MYMESLAHSWCLIAVVTVLSLGADPPKVECLQGKLQALHSAWGGLERATPPLCAETADPSSGENYICTVPQTLLLIHDTVPAGG